MFRICQPDQPVRSFVVPAPPTGTVNATLSAILVFLTNGRSVAMDEESLLPDGLDDCPAQRSAALRFLLAMDTSGW
jgi:hypothetical protein